MKQTFLSASLGFLVFLISLSFIADQTTKEARLISTSSPPYLQSEEQPVRETQLNNQTEKEREEPFVKKNDQEAAIVKPENSQGVVPVRLVIPSIGVDAPIEPEGYTETGAMDVPDSVSKVGWFEPGTNPGARGNAVIAGHVDGSNGPAVFYHLKELKAGDQLFVHGKDGSKLSFTVEKIAAYPLNEAPMRELFGPANQHALNLITCTGPYDETTGEYTERLAVFTVLNGPS